jgi:phosphotransferase system HPr (HPr) family protein
MTERTVTTARSLHARPASQLTKALGCFDAQVTLHVGAKSANAKSVLALMGLGLTAGAAVTVRAEGPDAPAAAQAVIDQLTTPEASAAPAQSEGA